MANILATMSTATLPTPSLPPRVNALARCVGAVDHGNGRPLYHLQGNRRLTAPELNEIEIAQSNMLAALDPDQPCEGYSADEARLALLTSMQLAFPGGSTSELASGAKFDWYETAISDIPVWAVARAMLRWARSDCPKNIEKEPRYSFAPSPGTLRQMAQLELAPYRRSLVDCDKLLACVPFDAAMNPDFKSPRHQGRAAVLRRM